MVETKQFKTKLCVLYRRGRCARETCTFAHGDSELRRFPPPPSDRRFNRDNDLRNKLDRKRSPLYRCSPGRDVKGLRGYKRLSPSQPSKRRKLRTHEHMDGPNDFSGGSRSPDGTADIRQEIKHVSSNPRKMLQDELMQVQYEVDVLLDQRNQLEIELEESVQRADGLSSRIRDLEAQLSDERDKSKRVNSKIKKFIRAHAHQSQLQDEIKRSQVQLEQLVGQLSIDAVHIGATEDKLNVNIISDEEVLEFKDHDSSLRKQLHTSMEAPLGSKLVTARGHRAKVPGSSRNSLVHFDNREADLGNKRKDIAKPSNENKPQRRNYASKSFDPLDKLKGAESNLVVPPTSMAAHAADEFVEVVDSEENAGVVETP